MTRKGMTPRGVNPRGVNPRGVNTEVVLRRGRPGDGPEIARIHVETWRTAYSGIVPASYLVGMTAAKKVAMWESSLRRKDGGETVLVAEALPGAVPGSGPGSVNAPEAEIVGFGSCGPARAGPCRGEVYTLYVAGDWQGQGIGRRLLGGLFEALRSAGVNDALIWVLRANPARFFYEAMAGQRLAERREPFAGVVLEETAYRWPDLAAWLAERNP